MSETIGADSAVLSAQNVVAGYSRSVPVLHGVSTAVTRGRTLGIVGESGSGKSTLARVLVGQLRPTSGTVRLDGVDRAAMRRRARFTALRRVQLVPQDPFSSLDPRMTVERTLLEAIDPRRRMPRRADRDRVVELLEAVALDASAAHRLPHEFSGGQRQRIVIARALAVDPEVILADEVTSSLDVSVQADILDLLAELQRQRNLTYVLITHDLAIAQHMCTDLDVLYLGRIVERGAVGRGTSGRDNVLAAPDHPYTRLLRDSIPDPSGRALADDPEPSGEEAADPAHPPAGCPFHPRCPVGPRHREDRERCITELPALAARDAGRQTACHYPIGALASPTPSLRNGSTP